MAGLKDRIKGRRQSTNVDDIRNDPKKARDYSKPDMLANFIKKVKRDIVGPEVASPIKASKQLMDSMDTWKSKQSKAKFLKFIKL